MQQLLPNSNSNCALTVLARPDDLDMALNSGLPRLYQACFGGAPYFEQYADDTVRGIFIEYFETGMSIVLAYDTSQNNVVGFSVKGPLPDNLATATGFSSDTTAFDYDIGVDPNFRRQGLSKSLEREQLRLMRENGRAIEVTRTSQANYRRIAANIQEGKVVLPLTEDVIMTRTNGETKSDKRIYFMKDLTTASNQLADLTLERVVIVSPGGNDTALVFDTIERENQPAISNLIQENYPGVEQVMFVETKNGRVYGQMAGGEFCGNATRSLAYVLAQDGILETNTIQMLAVSGTSRPLNVIVCGDASLAEMPITSKEVIIQSPSLGISTVEMEGISFIVLEEGAETLQTLDELQTVESKKAFVKNILDKYGFSTKPASGVLCLKQKDNKVLMDPYVYVRDTGSLYYETACGSGTAALGILEARRRRTSIRNYEVYQPSGFPISVDITYEETCTYAAINGPVSIEFDGRMPLVKEKPMSFLPKPGVA